VPSTRQQNFLRPSKQEGGRLVLVLNFNDTMTGESSVSLIDVNVETGEQNVLKTWDVVDGDLTWNERLGSQYQLKDTDEKYLALVPIEQDLESRIRDVMKMYGFSSIEEACENMLDDVADVWIESFDEGDE
jgi:hypothetical protein